jgi:hypothetical protein
VTLSVEGQKAPIEVKFGYPDKSGRYYCQTSTLSAPVFVLDTFKDKIPTGIDALKEEKKEEPAPLTPTPAITPKAGTTSAPPPPVKEAK